MSEEEVRVVACGTVEKRTIRIPDFVPGDHEFVYFTGRDRASLIRAALAWAVGDPPRIVPHPRKLRVGDTVALTRPVDGRATGDAGEIVAIVGDTLTVAPNADRMNAFPVYRGYVAPAEHCASTEEAR